MKREKLCVVNHVQRQRCIMHMQQARTWNDSFIIDSHVIIVLRHSGFQHLFTQRADRHMADNVQRTHNLWTHVLRVVDHLRSLWQHDLARSTVPQMTWYKQCWLRQNLFSYIAYACDSIEIWWEFLTNSLNFFHNFCFVGNFSISSCVHFLSCVLFKLCKLMQKNDIAIAHKRFIFSLQISHSALSNWAALNKFLTFRM